MPVDKRKIFEHRDDERSQLTARRHRNDAALDKIRKLMMICVIFIMRYKISHSNVLS
jgi:hypothetical protein